MRRSTRWLRSLQAQLSLWALLPVTLVAVGLALTGVYAHEQEMTEFAIERDRAVARLLASNLEQALRSGEVSPAGEALDDWLAAREPYLPGTARIVDSRGALLAESSASYTSLTTELVLPAAPDGSLQASDAAAGPVLVSYATIESTGWRLVLLEHAHDVTGPILRLAGLGPLAALIATALSLLLLIVGWRTVVQPLRRLSRTAAAVSWSNRAIAQEPPGGVTEIRDLHRILSDMVERLEGYQAGVLDYLNAVTKGQEEERSRLARELHDGTVQSLIALAQRAELAQHHISGVTVMAR